MDYIEDLKIDKYKLEDECLTQPIKMAKYSEKLTQAMYERDKLKRKLKVVRATAESDIRMDPAAFGLSKVTEASVSAAIELCSSVQKAEDDYILSVRTYNLLAGAVEAFRDRKRQLENVVRLFLSNYYSEPELPQSVDKVFEKKNQEKHREMLKSSMKDREKEKCE